MSEIHLLLGDCLEILPTIPDKSVDAIITDLPYGTTACKWDVIIPLDEMWKQVKRICRGAFVTTASQPFTSVLVCSNLEWFRYEWAWDKVNKTGHLNSKKMPMKKHENVLVFSQNGHTYNPQMFPTPKWSRARYKCGGGAMKVGGVYGEAAPPIKHDGRKDSYPHSIIDVGGSRQADKVHPTQKPVALYEYLIRTYTNEGDTVLDFCMGSGTTGVAAVKTGRNFTGIEKERPYFEIAERRITDEQLRIAEEGIHICGSCKKAMQAVRPGKYQCETTGCQQQVMPL